MSNDQGNFGRDDRGPVGAPVNFADKLVGSDGFNQLFEHGMRLVEDAAAYLDSEGREASKRLPRVGAMTYATESMRLTTRLMQLASWLLLQRAVNEGEMTLDQAVEEKSKVRLHSLSSSTQGPGWDDLPDKLKGLVEESIALQARIQRLDEVFYGKRKDDGSLAPNPVADQLAQLNAAFGRSS